MICTINIIAKLGAYVVAVTPEVVLSDDGKSKSLSIGSYILFTKNDPKLGIIRSLCEKYIAWGINDRTKLGVIKCNNSDVNKTRFGIVSEYYTQFQLRCLIADITNINILTVYGDEDFIMYVVIENMNGIDIKDLNSIELIEIKYYSENRNMFTTTSANESIVTQINVLDDENDMTIHINNDIYIFNSIQMENYCINITDWFGYLTIFDLTNDYIIYFDGFTQNTINQDIHSSCPSGNVTSTNSVTLEDGTMGYMQSINVNSISVNGSISLIRIVFGNSSNYNCNLTYYVHTGVYLNKHVKNFDNNYNIENKILYQLTKQLHIMKQQQ